MAPRRENWPVVTEALQPAARVTKQLWSELRNVLAPSDCKNCLAAILRQGGREEKRHLEASILSRSKKGMGRGPETHVALELFSPSMSQGRASPAASSSARGRASTYAMPAGSTMS